MPLWVACRVRAWKARSVPEEPVTFDELERLLLQLMGTSPEALEQQMRSHIKRETLVGRQRVFAEPFHHTDGYAAQKR